MDSSLDNTNIELTKEKTTSAHKRALFFDKSAKIFINTGGIAVIIAVIGILFFIMYEAIPLFFNSESEKKQGLNLNEMEESISAKLIGIDEYLDIIYVVTDSSSLDFISLSSKEVISSFKFKELSGKKITATSKDYKNQNIALGFADGSAAIINISYQIEFGENTERIITPSATLKTLAQIDSTNSSISKMSISRDTDDQYSLLVYTNGIKFFYYSEAIAANFFGESDTTKNLSLIKMELEEEITALRLDDNGEKIAVGTDKGNLYYYSVLDKSSPELLQSLSINTHGKKKITALSFVFGDQSLIVGDSDGELSAWLLILDDNSPTGRTLKRIHEFPKHNNEITGVFSSARNKSFITYDAQGNSHLYFLTSEKKLLAFETKDIPVKDISFAAKGNGAVILYKNGLIGAYTIDAPHPEVTFQTLFGKVWYEGYTKPDFVWQSTGGTDTFEPKFSIIPLVIGTLKGTCYAMLFAVPLALLGALYTSVFSHPKIKNIVKPTVEVMAALPSVVIGFLAGLWLAPLLEKIFPGVMMMFFILPVLIIVALYLWRAFHKSTGIFLKPGFEIFIIIPFIIAGMQLALSLGPWFENAFLGGDYRLWLNNFLDQNYDQRNSIIVGFAMGFTVIPIIFTICEDSLSSVPQHLKSASLALGASRWQTAVRVILPTASPGIFSAIMIGFGRAVGETMIVLMATGNTPILDFSPFNGMRTLSANIAVEIPEAPYHGSLYRILFLSAALLFILTFILNTAAEIIRQRLRKKYMHI